MGILTLLRNAFGRSRKGRDAEAEGADRTPSQRTEETPVTPERTSPAPRPTVPAQSPTAQVPEPRDEAGSSSDEHDLVAAAFNKVAVPKPASPVEGERVAEEGVAEEQVSGKETTAAEAVAEEPVTEAAPEAPVTEEPTPEPVVAEAEAEPVVVPAETPVAEESVSVEEPVVAEAEAVAEEPTPEPVVAEPAVAETPVAAEAVVEETAPEPEAEPVAEVVEVVVVPVVEEPVAETPEPESTPEPAATTVDEPVAAAVAEPTPAVVEPIAAAATPEPAAADGEPAPQGPPAPDNESITGGAGGNTVEADGEAEAEVPANDPVATALAKANLTGTQAKLYLVLDRSASMRPYYKDGSAQALADQTVALATNLDPEATVHVVFFSTEVDGTTDLTPTSPEDAIDKAHAGLGRMGRTSYHAAVEAVLAHYDKNATPGTPALVVFQTDGAPDAKTPATQSLTDAAKSHASVFFSFVAFGDHDNKAFDYLRKLKTTNTAFFHAGPTPLELTDAELYDGVLIDWRP